jgi:NAD(P)-dependent dehydrogenase (short-subunit alcohol dehydrogenase family)
MPKAAVAGLTRALAVDHAGEGIRVNAVRPGPIFTRFHERRATTAGKEFEDFKAEFGRNTMLKRPGTPREVAACILLPRLRRSLLRDRHLFVDGGQTAM